MGRHNWSISRRCWLQAVVLPRFQYWTPCKITVCRPVRLEWLIKSSSHCGRHVVILHGGGNGQLRKKSIVLYSVSYKKETGTNVPFLWDFASIWIWHHLLEGYLLFPTATIPRNVGSITSVNEHEHFNKKLTIWLCTKSFQLPMLGYNFAVMYWLCPVLSSFPDLWYRCFVWWHCTFVWMTDHGESITMDSHVHQTNFLKWVLAMHLLLADLNCQHTSWCSSQKISEFSLWLNGIEQMQEVGGLPVLDLNDDIL